MRRRRAVLQVDRLYAAATSLQEQAAAYAHTHPDRSRMLHCAEIARQEARSLAAALGFEEIRCVQEAPNSAIVCGPPGPLSP